MVQVLYVLNLFLLQQNLIQMIGSLISSLIPSESQDSGTAQGNAEAIFQTNEDPMAWLNQSTQPAQKANPAAGQPQASTQVPVPEPKRVQNQQQPAKHAQPAHRQHPREADPAQTDSRGMASRIMSRAGNFFKTDIMDELSGSQSKQQQKVDQQVMELLVEENRQLKQVVKNQSAAMEEVKEEAETTKLLEEETQEENEVLKYKVMSLEAEARIEKGRDTSELSLIDELNVSKKTLQKQADSLQRELKLSQKLYQTSQEDSQDDNLEELEDPQQALKDLRVLYEHNKIDFDKKDQLRVLTAIYLQDKPVIRMYRELLFQKIAQRALTSAEFLYKQAPPPSPSDAKQQSKIFLENKRLALENSRLKKAVQSLTTSLEQEKESRQFEHARNSQKLERVQAQASQLHSTTELLRASLGQIKSDVHFSQANFEEEVIQPNFDIICDKINAMEGVRQSREQGLLEQVSDMQRLAASLKQKAQAAEALGQRQQRDMQIKELGLTNKQKELEQQNRDLLSRSERAEIDSQQKETAYTEKLKFLTNQNSVLQQSGRSLQSKHDELQADLAEQNEMVNHLEFENNRQFTQNQNEVKAKDQAISDLKVQAQHDEQQSQAKLASLEKQIQILQQKLSGSPISGGAAEPSALSEMSLPEARQSLQEKSKRISEMGTKQQELEKMLDDKDDQIEELIQEVNKFQEEKSSPCAEKKPARDGPQGERQAAPAQNKVRGSQTNLGPEPRPDADEAYLRQPITIEVQGRSSEPRQTERVGGLPQNHQSDLGPFHSKVTEELEKVAQQRQENGGTKIPSFIEKNNVDSNFFSSMLADGGSEKTPAKTDDIFGFLNQPTDPRSKEDPFSAFATPKNFSTEKPTEDEDIFAMLSAKKKDEQPRPRPAMESIIEENSRFNQLQTEAGEAIEEAAWGDDDDIELDDGNEDGGAGQKQATEGNRDGKPPSSQFDLTESETAQGIALRSTAQPGTVSPVQERGEVPRQESLEHSPIKELPQTPAEDNFIMKNLMATQQEPGDDGTETPPGSPPGASPGGCPDEGADQSRLTGQQESSLLSGNPFDNSLARSEVQMVMDQMSRPGEGTSSPLSEAGRGDSDSGKRVNISSLSDAVPDEDISGQAVPEEAAEDEDDDSEGSYKSPGHKPRHSPEQDSAIILQSLEKSRERDEDGEMIDEVMQEPVLDQLLTVERRDSKHRPTPSLLEKDEFEGPAIEEHGEQSGSRQAEDPDQPLLSNRSEKNELHLQLGPDPEDDVDAPNHDTAVNIFQPIDPPGQQPASDPSSRTAPGAKPSEEYKSLTEFTNANLVDFQEEKTTESAGGEATGSWSREESLVNQTNEEADAVEEQPVTVAHSDSAYFTNDFRVLKNATYGKPDPADLAAKKLQEQFGDEFSQEEGDPDDFYEGRDPRVPDVLVSFQEDESKGAEPSFDHIDMDQLNANGNYQNDFNYAANNTNGSIQENLFLQTRMDGNNSMAQSDSLLIDGVMKGSFERGSLIEPCNIRSLIGSMVMQEGEVDGDDVQMRLKSAQTAQEEYEDGTPQVHEYAEDDGLPAVEEIQLQSIQTPLEEDESLETIDKQLSASSPLKPDRSNPVAIIDEQPLDSLFQNTAGGLAIETAENPEPRQGGWDDSSLEEIEVPAETGRDSRPKNEQVSEGRPSFREARSGHSPRNITEMKHMFFSSQKEKSPLESAEEVKTPDPQKQLNPENIPRQDTPLPSQGPSPSGEQEVEPQATGWMCEEELAGPNSPELVVPHKEADEKGDSEPEQEENVEQEGTSWAEGDDISLSDGEQPKASSAEKAEEKEEATPKQEEDVGGGWAEDDDISLSESSPVKSSEKKQEEEKQEVEPVLEQQADKPNEQNSLSMTQQAEIEVSEKFACPNEHFLTEINGALHALPARECSAYCGMSNKETDQNWLRCKECEYKVCYDCYHCDDGHEIAKLSRKEIHKKLADSMANLECTSCGGAIQEEFWICEHLASSYTEGNLQLGGCQDNRMICYDCLSAGPSAPKQQVAACDEEVSFSDDEAQNEVPQSTAQQEDEVSFSDEEETKDAPETTAQNEQRPPEDHPAPKPKKIDVDFDEMFSLQKNEPLNAQDPLSEILGKPATTMAPASDTKSNPLNDILQLGDQKNEPINEIFQMISTEKTNVPEQLLGSTQADNDAQEDATGGDTGGGWGDSDDELDI